jgi:hypothetical protein
MPFGKSQMFGRVKKQLRVEIVRRKESEIRFADWRADPTLCAMAAKVLADPNVQLMLSVLRNESPSKHVLHYDATLEARALMQARIEGYEMFLNNLEAMAVSVLPIEMPEANFAPTE